MALRRYSSKFPRDLRTAFRAFDDPFFRSGPLATIFPRSVDNSSFSSPSHFPTPFEAFDSFFGPRGGRDLQRHNQGASASWPGFGWPSFFSSEIEDPGGNALTGFDNWAPAVEVKNNSDHYVVHAQVPGAKKEDIKIEFVNEGSNSSMGREDPILVISGRVELEEGERPKVEGVTNQTIATSSTASETASSSSSSGAGTSEQKTTPAGESTNNEAEKTPTEQSGAQENQKQSQGWGFFRGNFTRSLRFDRPVNIDGVKAKYENGILKIEVPKREPDPPRETKSITIE